MEVLNNKLVLSEEDLREIFSLFASPAKYEKQQVYDANSIHFFGKVDLNGEYALTEEKREFALDAWRSTLFFLFSHGYSLHKNGELVDLRFIEEEFI